MFRAGVFFSSMLVVFALGGLLSGDEPKKETPPPVKGRASLPQNWNKLGLTDEQKQQIYATRDEYRGKIAVLQAQIKDLQRQERRDLEKVLTDAQKQRLREILAEKAPASGSKDEKKPDKVSPDKKP
jgi:Spy/CpxP family protein refolding chaperone